MFNRVLNRIREAVRTGDYIVTRHAKQELNEDRLTIYDLEQSILKGDIIRRQIDPQTGESKFIIRFFETGRGIETVVKISSTGHPVVITVYKL